MKKISRFLFWIMKIVVPASLLCTFLFSICFADDNSEREILFRNIPWGTSASEFLNTMEENRLGGYISDQSYLYSWELKDGNNMDDSVAYIEDSGFYYYSSMNDVQVAGVPVKYIYAYFLYSFDKDKIYRDEEHSSLYKAEYYLNPVDIAATYPILVEKLSSLYGEGKTKSGNKGFWNLSGNDYTSYYEAIIWEGANNTGVRLFMEYQIDDITKNKEYTQLRLDYGKTNSVILFNELTEALSKEQTNNILNYSGTDGL